MSDLMDLLKAMGKMWEPLEEKWAFTEILYKLEDTCSIHGVGERNFEQMRYRCPTCKKFLKKEKI